MIVMIFEQRGECTMNRLSFIITFLMLMLPVQAFSMGILGGKAERIPMPAKNLSFTVVDKLGVRTSVEHGSIDGKDYLSGYNGLILNIVPLSNITSIDFTNAAHTPSGIMLKVDKHPVTAIVHFKDDKTLSLTVSGLWMCYGMTPYGSIQVNLESIDAVDNVKLIKK